MLAGQLLGAGLWLGGARASVRRGHGAEAGAYSAWL